MLRANGQWYCTKCDKVCKQLNEECEQGGCKSEQEEADTQEGLAKRVRLEAVHGAVGGARVSSSEPQL